MTMNQPKENVPVKWNTKNQHSPFAGIAQQFYPISEATIKYIDEHTFIQTIKKGKYLLKSGEICRHIYLVQKGAVRGFVKEGTKEITTWITTENNIVSSIKGFESQEPCTENIQAIEDCELISADYDALQVLYKTHMEMNIVGRKLYELYYRDAEERAFICRLTKASSKYNHFVKTRGYLINRIPLKYVASYLGMTIETLSRMRSKLNNSKKHLV